MDRVFDKGAAASPPAPPATPSSGYPTAGDPATGQMPTQPGPYWFHQITEELRNAIVAGGLTPDHTKLTQLRDAINALIGRLGEFDLCNLSAAFYPPTAGVFYDVTTFQQLISSGNFTLAGGVFTCVKGGRYRVAFLPSDYNQTGLATSSQARLLFSTVGTRANMRYTFCTGIAAYGGLGTAMTIVDLAPGDTFSAQFYAGSTANGSIFLETITQLIMERMQ